MEPEPLVKELLENHQKDKDLTGPKVQEEVKKLRKKYKRIAKGLEDDEQLIGLDWTNADLEEFNLMNLKLSDYNKEAVFKNANLKLSTLTNSVLSNANLHNAELQGISMQGSKSQLNGANLSNASLAAADLNEADLRGAQLKQTDLVQANLIGTDLTEANLEGANLWKTDLRGAKLFNANLRNTNLDNTDFRYSNLYMARFATSNIQYAFFSVKVIHEIKKKELDNIIAELEQGKIEKRLINIIKQNTMIIIKDKDRFYKASQIYRELKNTYHQIGDYESESNTHYKERRAHTKDLISKRSYRGPLHWLFKILCGYGEKWYWIIFWIIVTVLLFGTIFWAFNGVIQDGGDTSLNPLDYYYFSAVTFTTLGFGDLYPNNSTIGLNTPWFEIDIPQFRIAAGTEALFGAILMALFVVVFAKRMFR